MHPKRRVTLFAEAKPPAPEIRAAVGSDAVTVAVIVQCYHDLPGIKKTAWAVWLNASNIIAEYRGFIRVLVIINLLSVYNVTITIIFYMDLNTSRTKCKHTLAIKGDF